MLLFNIKVYRRYGADIMISIHLMLLFNVIFVSVNYRNKAHFNTSNVTIQLDGRKVTVWMDVFQYI